MGYQLLVILTMNMLGGLILLPALISLIRPRFVTMSDKEVGRAWSKTPDPLGNNAPQ
jgi:hypothetical protein